MTASLRARWLLVASAVMLGLALLFPLWRISLIAPQYPEGLGMHIWAHTVAGIGPNDLQNINGLNHYIGMKVIVPDSIPELRIMPPGIVVMCVLGLLIAWRGSRRLLQLWVVALVLAALVGLADFYRWEYDYGHNLDLEHAPIKVPGMTYQPPLIGSKKLLNFTATSWPAPGGVLAIVAVMTGVAAGLTTLRESRPVNAQASNDGNARADASLRKATV